MLTPYLIIVFIEMCKDLICHEKITVPYYWYLDFMFFWYLAFYLCICSQRLYEKKYLVIVILAVGIFLVDSLWGNGLRAEQALSFATGVYISDNYEKASKYGTNWYALISLITIGVLLLGLKQLPDIRGMEDTICWQVIQLLLKLVCAIAFMGIIYKTQRLLENRFTDVSGNLSYELYLVHFRLLTIISNKAITVVTFFISSMIGAWVLKLLVEMKNKVIKQ